MRGWLIAMFVCAVGPAVAYPVGPAIPLEELAKKADVVCKATVVADKKVTDATFAPVTAYDVHETEMRVVSCVKGAPGKALRFRHYMYAPAGVGIGYAPLAYDLKVGKTYVVFAVKGAGGALQQFQRDHTQLDGQGVQLAADDKPHRGTSATEVVWNEVVALAKSGKAEEAIEGIKRLDQLSGGGDTRLSDFARDRALVEVRAQIGAKDEAIATAAIEVFGADSPYFRDDQAQHWLAGIGKGSIPGLSGRKPPANPSANVAVKELTDVANRSAKLRPLAIRALGRSRLAASIVEAWARDPDPEVRRAAVMASTELVDRTVMFNAATDAVAGVRRSAALAMGFSQESKLLPYLDKLLKDADVKVRAAAAMAILSFALDKSEATLLANLKGDYRSLFVNALARRDPKPHLAALGEVIEKQLQPASWWGGRIPAADSWEILFDYAKKLPASHLSGPQFSARLDSLEKMKWYSSSQPRDLYALYVRRKMAARATAFRAKLVATVSYNIDQFLDEADKYPERFVP